MEPVTAPAARCAHCTDPVGAVWQVMTGRRTVVICGAGGCEQWAWAQGLSPFGERPGAARSRRAKVCAGCGGELPRRTRDRFREGGREMCSLTCVQSGR